MPHMIGRATERDSLIRALERARDGHGTVALISGEAGIGKTTLAAELRSAAESHGIVSLWGRTPEAAWAGPYAPWIEALSTLDGGAEDLNDSESSWDIITAPHDFKAVQAAVEAAGIPIFSAELSMIAQTAIPVNGGEANQVLRLIEALEDLDDVQNVYANFDIPEEVMAAL